MSSTVAWGPSGWRTTETFIFNLQWIKENPRSQFAQKAKKDLSSLPLVLDAWRQILPCGACRESAQGFLERVHVPPNASRIVDVAAAIHELHNLVNDKRNTNGDPTPQHTDFEGWLEHILNRELLDTNSGDYQNAVDAFWNLVLPYALAYEPHETNKVQAMRNFSVYAYLFLPCSIPDANPLSPVCSDMPFKSRWTLFYCLARQSPYYDVQNASTSLLNLLVIFTAAKSTLCTKVGCR